MLPAPDFTASSQEAWRYRIKPYTSQTQRKGGAVWGAPSPKNRSTPVSTPASRTGALSSKFGKFAKIITDRIQHAEEETAVYFCYRSCLVSESQVKSEDCALRTASRVRRRLRAAV